MNSPKVKCLPLNGRSSQCIPAVVANSDNDYKAEEHTCPTMDTFKRLNNSDTVSSITSEIERVSPQSQKWCCPKSAFHLADSRSKYHKYQFLYKRANLFAVFCTP